MGRAEEHSLAVFRAAFPRMKALGYTLRVSTEGHELVRPDGTVAIRAVKASDPDRVRLIQTIWEQS